MIGGLLLTVSLMLAFYASRSIIVPVRSIRQFTVESDDGALQTLKPSGVPEVDEVAEALYVRARARRIAQEAAAETEALLNDAIDSISGGFLVTDAEDRLVLFNRQMTKFYPDCLDALKQGAPYLDFLWSRVERGYYPEAIGVEESWFADALARHREAVNEAEIKLPDGRWLLVSERRMSSGGVAGVSIDITALKAAEEALRRSEQELLSAQSRTEEAIVALRRSEEQLNRAQKLAKMGSDTRNLQTDEAQWSDETYRIFGVSRGTFVPTTENFLAMLYPDDREKVLETRKQLAAGIVPAPFEYRIIDRTVAFVTCIEKMNLSMTKMATRFTPLARSTT